MNCPRCNDETESRRIDECGCGWAQTSPIEDGDMEHEGLKRHHGCTCDIPGNPHSGDCPLVESPLPEEVKKEIRKTADLLWNGPTKSHAEIDELLDKLFDFVRNRAEKTG